MNAYFALGYACNHHCLFCPCGKDRQYRTTLPTMNLSSFKENFFKAVSEKHITSITLSGGEPALQPHFCAILEFLSTQNVAVTVLTNADLISQDTIMEKIAAVSNPQQVHFVTAIHSYLAEIHDHITGSSGSHERSLRALFKLQELGYKTTIKHIINALNYQDMEKYSYFVDTMFDPKVALLFCGMDYCGMSDEQIELTKVDFQTAGKSLEKALDVFVTCPKKRPIHVTEFPLCAVDPYYWKYYSFTSRSRLSAYAAPVKDTLKSSQLSLDVQSDCGPFFKACAHCKVASICPGVWRTATEVWDESSVIPLIES